MLQLAVWGRLRSSKKKLDVGTLGRSGHVLRLFARCSRPLTIMPSADQVPLKSTHSKMPWPKCIVLIVG
jgi:hypothetical protein